MTRPAWVSLVFVVILALAFLSVYFTFQEWGQNGDGPVTFPRAPRFKYLQSYAASATGPVSLPEQAGDTRSTKLITEATDSASLIPTPTPTSESTTSPGTNIPHVSECYFCHKCHLIPPNNLQSTKHLLRSSHLQSTTTQRSLLDAPPFQIPSTQQSQTFLTSEGHFAPTAAEGEAKMKLPNCTECYGCSVELQPLSSVRVFGINVKLDIGNSPQYIYVVDLPGTSGMKAIVKIWCIPIHKFKGHFMGWDCMKGKDSKSASAHLLAMQGVLEDCGLQDVTPRVWVAPVNAVLPGIGLHVWWDALWQERAPGISMNYFAFMTNKGQLTANRQLDIMQEKLNKSRVVQAAISDLLTGQCDRHSQNVLLDSSANIHLIDNLQAAGWDFKCGFDSIFLPTSQKAEIVRFGGDVVFKRTKKLRASMNPMVLFDYRCYVKGGEMGTRYGPQLQQCLANISAMTPAEVKRQYGFPRLGSGRIIQRRAKDMLSEGFEWTLVHGSPRNPPGKTYKLQPPCCKLRRAGEDSSGDSGLRCAHKWEPVLDMPAGDPIAGGPVWRGAGEDPGTWDSRQGGGVVVSGVQRRGGAHAGGAEEAA